nr:glutamate receptor ionotropic, delta-1-like [Cherax quadricarinatus]
MILLGYLVLALTTAAVTVGEASVSSQEVGGAGMQVALDVGGAVKQMSVDLVGAVEKVGVMVGQVVDHHLSGCHLVLITTTSHSLITTNILRRLSEEVKSRVLVEAGKVLFQDQLLQDKLLQGLWGDTRTTCRGLILDITHANNTDLILGFLEQEKLWKWAETGVVVVGGRAGVKDVLLHHSLRNTLHAIYLALHDLTLHAIYLALHISQRHRHFIFRKHTDHEATVRGDLTIYRRCLYCNNGKAEVQNVSINAAAFSDELENLRGHRFRVVTVPYFPYMDYYLKGEERGGQICPRDSLDVRLINTFAATINFTFDIYAEPDRFFGDERNGSFTGMIGQLQREETDFSTIVAPTAGRLKVVEFLKAYPSDVMVITSLKPALLPAYLSIIRPFSEEVWAALLLSMMAWVMILWLLQRAWWYAADGQKVQFINAMLYGWGALLGQPPPDPSVNLSGQMLVGWWLMFCLVISAVFSSSLIAHLTVQGKSPTLDSFQDLIKRDNWKWGTEPWLFGGAAYEYFAKHTDPAVNRVYRGMEVLVVDEALKKVLAGRFSLIDFKNYINVVVASRYTDAFGVTPFYISNKGISVIAVFGWGLRKVSRLTQGSPFYSRFIQLMSRLEDTGIISYWTEDIMAKRVRESRLASSLNLQLNQANALQGDDTKVVLGLTHMQGAFYLFFVGCSVAFLTLLGEKLTHWFSSSQQRSSKPRQTSDQEDSVVLMSS